MASSKERVAYVIERLNIATDGNVQPFDDGGICRLLS